MSSEEFTNLKRLLEKLPSDEREVRRMRKSCPEFDQLIGAIYKFVQIDKIRAKAVRLATRIPRHVRKTREAHNLYKARNGRLPDIGPTPDSDTDHDGHRPCYMCHCALYTHNASPTHNWFCNACDLRNNKYLTAQIDLRKKFAVVTGGRIKVGFHIALRLLRMGATVAVSSRFPADTLSRYSAMEDYESWRGRLHIIGADFRSLSLLESFVARIRELTDNVHILVNNAAQTVRRPAVYYKSLLEGEARAAGEIGASAMSLVKVADGPLLPMSVSLNVMANGPLELYRAEDFPEGQKDIDGQQLDLRRENSWTQTIGKVHIAECLETQVINSVAPFYIIQQLEPLFSGSFILNITSAEGRKGPKFAVHPHNNMSKAALNMLTQTIAGDYLRTRDTIVVGIDTGWANTMVGATKMAKLTYEDSAARAIQPLVDERRREYAGKLLRNYDVVPW
jgi:NAD(P)-dependent dehydrogenase (short-subunit alcohol dehydrogenase family)